MKRSLRTRYDKGIGVDICDLEELTSLDSLAQKNSS